MTDYSAEYVATLNLPELENLYSSIMATAHDIGFEIPGELLVETEDADVLRGIIPQIHLLLEEHKAIPKDVQGEPLAEPEAGVVTKPKRVSKKKTTTEAPSPEPALAPAKAPSKQSKKGTAPKADKTVTESTMAKTATAAKAAKTAPAKKAAKAAPAKKAAAGKKAATENARTPRTKYSDKATIKVLVGENPGKKGTGRFDRIANMMKHDGKLVSDFLKKGGKSGTLSFSVAQGWIKIVG